VTNQDFPCPAWKIAIGSLTTSALATLLPKRPRYLSDLATAVRLRARRRRENWQNFSKELQIAGYKSAISEIFLGKFGQFSSFMY
jgi:hypothetical protein